MDILKNSFKHLQIAIVGGGVAGIQLCFAIHERFQKIVKRIYDNCGKQPTYNVSLFTSQTEIVTFYNKSSRRKVLEALKKSNILAHTNARVTAIQQQLKQSHQQEKQSYRFSSQKTLKFESIPQFKCNIVIWATGADPQLLCNNINGIQLCNGYIQVNGYLQSVSHPDIFGAGDTITISEYKDRNPIFPQKAGVYAVRQGPILAHNLIQYARS